VLQFLVACCRHEGGPASWTVKSTQTQEQLRNGESVRLPQFETEDPGISEAQSSCGIFWFCELIVFLSIAMKEFFFFLRYWGLNSEPHAC
jgi:hypothetical protein